MPRRKNKPKKEVTKLQAKAERPKKTSQTALKESKVEFKVTASSIKSRHDSSKLHTKKSKFACAALLPLAAAVFVIDSTGQRLICGLVFLWLIRFLFRKRFQARLALENAEASIKLWRSLLHGLRSDWQLRWSKARTCTDSINNLKKHLPSLDMSQIQAKIDEEIVTNENNVVRKQIL